MNCTIIIPIFSLKEERLRNFEICLKNCISSGLPIIVVEQLNKNQKFSPIKKGIEYLKIPNLKWLGVKLDTNLFHKTKLINIATKNVNTKWIWEIDADCILPINEILLSQWNTPIIKPFDLVVNLSEKETKDFIQNKSIQFNKGEIKKSIKKFGALSFIIDKEVFINGGMMNEEFVGYGWEDLEFAERFKKIEITEIQQIGVHLWHYIKKNEKDEKENRKRFLETLKNLSKKEQFIGISKNKINNLKESPIATNIVHITTAALDPSKKELYQRECLGLKSIVKELESKQVLVKPILVTDGIIDEWKQWFTILPPIKTAKEIGDTRGLPLLCDLFSQALQYCDNESVIFYTNSDCCLRNGTYTRICEANIDAIQYHRQNVMNNPKTLNEIFRFPRKPFEIGVDGIAIKKQILEEKVLPINKWDFYVGEQHWDTCLGGYLRQFNIGIINTRDLFHPYHSDHRDSWTDPSKIPLAAKHNDELYREFTEYGLLNDTVLSLPEVDTSVVVVHFGTDPKRIRAVKKNLKELDKQTLETEFIFVEAIEGKTQFPEVKQNPMITHIEIPIEPGNKEVGQKEAMMNIGGKIAKGPWVIFCDSDVHSKDVEWFSKIREKLVEDPIKMVQGFKICLDSKDKNHCFVSKAALDCGYSCDLNFNPGMVWGLSKEVLEENDYFCPWVFYGSGDSIGYCEYTKQLDDWIFSFPKINNIKRDLPIQCKIDYVNINTVHCNHGAYSMEFYKTRHKLLDSFNGELTDYLEIGKNRLVKKK